MLLRREDVLKPGDLAKLRELLGKARFHDGTMSGRAAIKNNLQTRQTGPDVDAARAMVTNALMGWSEFTSYALPKKLVAMFNRYEPGMRYDDHIDAALMGPSQAQAIRADLSFTVFLTDPAEFEGGEFVLTSPYGEIRLREPAGSAIVYPSMMLHRVEPVSRGARQACVGWIQSFIQDPTRRDIAWRLDGLRREMGVDQPASPYTERMAQIYQNLMRLWTNV